MRSRVDAVRTCMFLYGRRREKLSLLGVSDAWRKGYEGASIHRLATRVSTRESERRQIRRAGKRLSKARDGSSIKSQTAAAQQRIQLFRRSQPPMFASVTSVLRGKAHMSMERFATDLTRTSERC